MVIHDLAYADLVFDGYEAPSFFRCPGAKDSAVEFFSMSKSYSMAGWRVGFCVGNTEMVSALTRIKSYLDYGVFQPIQIAAIIALNGDQSCVEEIVSVYKITARRPGGRSEPHGLDDRKAQGHHVCLGANSGAFSQDGVGGVLQVPDRGSQGGRLARSRVWRVRG